MREEKNESLRTFFIAGCFRSKKKLQLPGCVLKNCCLTPVFQLFRENTGVPEHEFFEQV